MIEIIKAIVPFISGLWALPWILIGFLVTIILSKLFSEDKVSNVMKKIGLILLFFFVPLLLFKIFLGVDFQKNEIIFTIGCILIFSFMYLIAYFYAIYKSKSLGLKEQSKIHFIKTVLTNQGRSSAFIGGAMLAIAEWQVYAAIYMSIGAIFLFALIPYILYHTSKRLDTKQALPWYLRLFPWYLITFGFAAIFLHTKVGVSISDLGYETSTIFIFITSLTIPAALYYVGAGIHPHDLKIKEIKKLFKLSNENNQKDHWIWVRSIFFLTIIITPIIILIILSILFLSNIVSSAMFSVIIINSILPITSTNMFLVPYGIDKRVTALAVTWTTIVSVPIVVLLIYLFKIIF